MARILLIDDNEEFRQMMKLILTQAGHEVQTASSGEEGLVLFGKAPTDVVVVDILMPGRGGLETINDLAKGSNCPKLIAISGGFLGEPESTRKLAATLGVDRTLGKPFSPDQLVRAVNDVLAG